MKVALVHDWLTGIYNRGATETKINQLLAEKKTGVLFVLAVIRNHLLFAVFCNRHRSKSS